jgi:hypothetical protein
MKEQYYDARILGYASSHQATVGDSAGGFGGNGGGGSPSAVSHIVRCVYGMLNVGGWGGNGGGGSPSATSLFLFEISPATAARPTAIRVTMSMRFMFSSPS